MMRKSVWIVVGLIVACLGLAAETSRPLVIGLTTTGPLLFVEGRLDKAAGPALMMSCITPLAHQRWATVDPDGNFVPLLAEAWTISQDGMKITVYIRKNARWSDGHPIVANDMLLTFEVLKKEPVLDDWGLLPYIENIIALDEKTFEVRLNRPFFPFIQYFFEYFPIPSHIYKTAENYLDPKTLEASETISSGPYKIVGFAKGTTTIRMVANEYYWGGPPPFPEVIIQLLSPDAFVPALMATGQYDIIEVSKPAQVAALLGLPNVLVRTYDTRGFWIWNMGVWTGILMNNAVFPLSEKQFRQAIAYAVDRGKILEIAAMGYGELSSMGFHPARSPHVAPDLPTYPYNPDKAKELIQGLGFTMGPDGIWRYPDSGKKLSLKVQARAGEETLVGSLVVEMLKAIGIDATLETLASPVYASNFDVGNFELGVIKTGQPDIVDFLMMKFYWPTVVPLGETIHYRGWIRWADPHFGDLLEKYRAASDPEEAQKLSYEMQRIIAEDLPFIGLYYGKYIWAYNTATLANLEITARYDWPRLELVYGLRRP
jgi:peptide/nickel transport system substrate-binding protein